MASYLGLGTVVVKDESFRYGLNSFKALGGAYAMGRFLAGEVGRDISELSYSVLTDEHFLKTLAPCTFFSATDGNHGRGVAWTARMLHQRCVILMPKGTAKSRFDNIRALGAEVTIEDLNYDECVDTSWPGYFDIPSWIMQGYGVMADEAAEQLGTRPTHVFVQAGVGCMAGAVTGYFSALYPDNPPKIIVVEPHAADCMYRSNEKGDGSRVIVDGDMDSCMAGLACGEPCEIGWDLFRNHATGFISGEDRMTQL